MRFEPVDRPPLLEWRPWESTTRAWMAETGKDRGYVLRYLNECDPSESAVCVCKSCLVMPRSLIHNRSKR